MLFATWSLTWTALFSPLTAPTTDEAVMVRDVDLCRLPSEQLADEQISWLHRHRTWLEAQQQLYWSYGPDERAAWQARLDYNLFLATLYGKLSNAQFLYRAEQKFPHLASHNADMRILHEDLLWIHDAIGGEAYNAGLFPPTGDAEYFAP